MATFCQLSCQNQEVAGWFYLALVALFGTRWPYFAQAQPSNAILIQGDEVQIQFIKKKKRRPNSFGYQSPRLSASSDSTSDLRSFQGSLLRRIPEKALRAPKKTDAKIKVLRDYPAIKVSTAWTLKVGTVWRRPAWCQAFNWPHCFTIVKVTHQVVGWKETTGVSDFDDPQKWSI